MEYLICRDPDYGLASNDDYPHFEGPHDKPIWSLFVEDPDYEDPEGCHYFGEWHMMHLGADLTYQEAYDLVDKTGWFRVIGHNGAKQNSPEISKA
jgi:hypothetical protein